MSTITLRSVKGTPLTNQEVDDNFSNLNTDKLQLGGTYSSGTASGVLYLSNSKVLTTGSALTFDGTNFNVIRAAATDQYMSLYADGTGPTFKFFGGAAGKVAGITADSASAQMLFTNEGNKPFVYQINGTEGMRLTSTGLGIGTNSPQKKLVVSNAGAVGMEWSPTDYANNMRQLAYNRTTSAYVALRTEASQHEWFIGGTEAARIDPSSNLLIGTTTNTNTSKLVVNGTISETVSSTQYLVASQFDIGTAPNKIPLNQYLGNLAYQDAANIAGQLGVSAGTAALPAIVSATNTNTGQWFPAANTIAWSTNGTERLRVDSSGNLGIGTSSPVAKLSVADVATPRLALQVGSQERAYLGYTESTFTTRLDSDGPLQFAANNAVAATIDLSGNLGIGTSSPSAKLHVVGNQFRQNDATTSQGYVINTTSATTRLETLFGGSSFAIRTGASASDRLFIDGSGNVGIGTSSPATKLDVVGASGVAFRLLENSTGNNNRLQITQSGTDAIYNATYSAGSASQIWQIANSEKMRLDSSGNLGLGVTPSAQTGGNLQLGSTAYITFNNSGGYINGNAVYSSGWKYQSSAYAVQYLADSYSGAHKWYTAPSGTAGAAISFTQAMTLDASGNLGVGTTSPSEKLHVVGNSRTVGDINAWGSGGTVRARLTAIDAVGYAYVGTISNHAFLFFTNSAERARIDSSGNLLVTGPGGLGYGTGSGGAVTQATSRTTGVTLNKTNGAITLVSAAGTATWQTFTVTNSTVAATDTIIVNQKSGTDLYQIFVTAVAAGSFNISFATTGGTTTEQPVFNFAVIKAVTA